MYESVLARAKKSLITEEGSTVGSRGSNRGCKGEAGGGVQKILQNVLMQLRKAGKRALFFCTFTLVLSLALTWHLSTANHPLLHRSHFTDEMLEDVKYNLIKVMSTETMGEVVGENLSPHTIVI